MHGISIVFILLNAIWYHSLSDILTELIEFSRLDSGVTQPSLTPLRAEEIFRNIETDFAPLAMAERLRLKFFFPRKELLLLTDLRCF